MPMIRSATAKDVPAVAKTFQAARVTAMPWLPVLHTPAGDLKFFERLVLSKDRFEVAEIDDHVAGFCCVQDDWIEQLYIHPDHQWQGLGSAFIQRAKTGKSHLQLWVFEQNLPAQSFYAAHGFICVEKTDGSNNEERCPDQRMTWDRS